MNPTLTSIDSEWRKLPTEDGAREILVRNFKAKSMIEAARAVAIVAGLATKYDVQEEVYCSVGGGRVSVILHALGEGGVTEPFLRLASSIDESLMSSEA